MNVLVADKFPQKKIDELKKMDCTVQYNQNLTGAALLDELKRTQPDILIVRSTEVSGDMITLNPHLNLIIRAGAGFNTIDVKTASERSVYVANCPGKNSIAVAELAFGLILAIDRRIPDNVIELRNGRWNKKEFSKAEGLFGKTLGIIGLGRIGKELILRARAFGMKVIAWSRSLTPRSAEELEIGYCATPLEVASLADVVSVHLALTPETKNFIGWDFFKHMKPGAYFINTSRAEIVEEDALLQAMNEKGIRAGADVFSGEPAAKEGRFENPLVSHSNFYGTHHIGASTDQAQNAVADETLRIVREYLETGHVPNCVNRMEHPPARSMISIHHKNRVGVLAGVLDVIRDAGINVETMENVIFEGAEGACARIQIDGVLPEEELEKIEKSNENILAVSQVELK